MQAPGRGAMVYRRARRPIAADDVPRIFDPECINDLAKLARLPVGTDLDRLLSDVRAAASIYATDVRKPDANKVHHEIEAFYNAALGRQCERAASLRKNLSPEALAWFKARLDRPGPRMAGLRLPSARDFLDTGPARRDHACEMVETICRIGGEVVEGRMRRSGKRSRPTFRPLLHAPELRRHFPKRDAELDFVASLARAWETATGKPPARTADRRAPGPFARFVRRCLDLIGATDANAIKLINRLGSRAAR
jgi:hypothetical protein